MKLWKIVHCTFHIWYQEYSEDSNQNIDRGRSYNLKITYQRSQIKSFVREVDIQRTLTFSRCRRGDATFCQQLGKAEKYAGCWYKGQWTNFLSAVSEHPKHYKNLVMQTSLFPGLRTKVAFWWILSACLQEEAYLQTRNVSILRRGHSRSLSPV